LNVSPRFGCIVAGIVVSLCCPFLFQTSWCDGLRDFLEWLDCLCEMVMVNYWDSSCSRSR
jgi:hypothetical protein